MGKGPVILEARGRQLGQLQKALCSSPSSQTNAMVWRLWIDLGLHLVKDLRKCMNTERNAMPNYVSIDYFFQTLLNGSKLNSGVIFFFQVRAKAQQNDQRLWHRPVSADCPICLLRKNGWYPLLALAHCPQKEHKKSPTESVQEIVYLCQKVSIWEWHQRVWEE